MNTSSIIRDEVKKKLLVVYNADSGILNNALSSLHKIVSPTSYSCSLCAITHHSFGMQKEWKAFLESTNAKVQVYHKNDFVKTFPKVSHLDLPAIFSLNDQTKELVILLKPSEIRGLNLEDLINKLTVFLN